MLRKWNRLIAFILAFALITSTFNSDFASIRAFAEDGVDSLETPAPEPAPAPDPAPTPDPAPAPEPDPAPAPEPDPAPTPDPAPAEEPVVDPAPAADPAQTNPDPVVDPAPVDPAAGDTPVLDGEQVDPLLAPVDPSLANPENPEEEEEEEEAAEPVRMMRNASVSGITITYTVDGNGTIDNESDFIADGDENPEIEGSTATASEGSKFDNWTDENGDEVSASDHFTPSGDQIYDGATYTAHFTDIEVAPEVTTEYEVIFQVDGNEYRKTIYTDDDNSLTLPERPFKAGYYFTGWEYNGSIISEGTKVEENMVIVATFKEIELFNLTVKYYYVFGGTEYVFDSSSKTIAKGGFPVTIESPANTSVSADTEHPVYYPSQDYVTFTESDIDYTQEATLVDGIATLNLTAKRVQYIPYNVFYTAEYYLKDLEGDGYTLKESQVFEANMGQIVTPPVKTVDGWIFEKTESVEITEENQKVPVYYTRANYTLHYDTDGGSYIEAVTAPFESVISVSTTKPTKLGYKFENWYLDEELTQPAGNTVTLTKDTTIYAKWTPQQVDYTILYLTENADDDGFSFKGSVTKKATVGSEVTVTAADAKPDIFDSPIDYEFKDAETATVKADGSTVIKARYSRKVYTISWNGDVYNINGRRYATGQGTASITAKYGAKITTAFAREFNDKYPEYAWSFTTKNNDKFVNIDTMPSYAKVDSPPKEVGHEVVAFDFSTEKVQVLHYWLENYNGSQTTTRNGRTYGLYKAQRVKFNYLYRDIDFYEIEGYTRGDYTATYVDWRGRTQNYTLGDSTPNYELNVNFYYIAETYTLAFYDYHGSLISTHQVALNKDITSYMNNAKPDAPVDGATWLGWYTDAEHAAAYSGNNLMPTGLALYANWQLPSFTFTFMDEGTKVQEDTIEYGKKAQSISREDKPGFTFGGWFTSTDYTQAYDFAKPVTEETTVYAKWVPKTLFYTVRYVDAETGEDVADPKTVISPVFKKGDTVTEDSIIITGRIADATSKSTVLDYENNEIVFEYSPRQGQITYTVKYVLKEHHDIQVHEPKTKTVSGSFLSVTEAAAPVDKQYMADNYTEYAEDDYYPENDVISYNLSAGNNEIIFEYNSYANGRVVVHYLDMAGNPIVGKDSVTLTGKAGNSYHIDTELSGYTYKKITDDSGNIVSASGNFREGQIVRKIYYQKDLTIRAKNKDKVYDGTALYSEGIGDAVVEGLMSGHALKSISYTGSQTLGGSSPTTPHDAVIMGAPDDYYNITYLPGTLTVTKKTVTVTIVGDIIEKTYDGEEATAGYQITSISDTSFLPSYIQFNGQAETITLKDAGSKTLALENMFSVMDAYKDSFTVSFNVSNGSIKITPKTITIRTKTIEKVYDGNPLTCDYDESNYSIEGLVKDETLVFDGFISEITNVGWVYNEIGPFDWNQSTAKEDNYSIDWQNGKLIINPATVKITVTGNKDTVNYDGAEHTVSGYVVTADNENYNIANDLTAPKQEDVFVKGTNVGKYPLNIEDYEFANENTNFNATIEYVDGELEIIGSKTVKVNITGNKDEVAYDGENHSVSGYTVSITNPDGITPYTEADFEFKGTATASGTNVGTYAMNLQASDFTNKNNNYTVEFEIEEDGKLVVNPREVTVTITGNTDSKVYNGDVQQATGYTVETSYEKYTEADFEFKGNDIASGTDASETPYMMGLSEDDFTNTSTANYNVTFKVTDGSLTITKRPVTVTVTGNTDTKTYNGQVQTVEGYETSISDDLYEESFFTEPEGAIASLKEVGQEYMGLTAGGFANTNDNFDVTFDVTDGWIKITPTDEKVTITVKGNSDTVKYNGEVQSITGITTAEPIPDTITLTYDESKAVASGKDAGTYYMGLTTADFTATSNNYSNIEIVVEDGWLKIEPATRPDNLLPTVEGYEDTYDAEAHGLTITGALPGDTFSYEFGGNVQDTEPFATHVDESIDSITVIVHNDNYIDQELPAVPITILPAALTITTSKATKEYDGTPLTSPAASTEGFVAGESATVVANGSITEVGSTDNTYEITWDNAKESDYAVTEVLKKLEITPSTREITFQAPSDSKTYDGTALTADGTGEKTVTVNNLPAGYTAEALASGSQTDAGSSANVVSVVRILKDGEDKTESFSNIKKVDGTLTVNPKAVTITTGSASKRYDGTPLTKDEASIDGLVEGESVTLKAKGTITEVGDTDNTYEITWDNAKAANYTVTESLGTLTVTTSDVQVLLTAGSATKPYDGTALTKISVTSEGLPAGYYAEVEISGSQTDAGESANTIVSHKIYNAEGSEKTANFTNVKYVHGKLTVTKAPVTVTTGSETKPYDGQELTKDEATIEGLIDSEKDLVTIKATGKIKNVGKTDNTYEIQWGNVNPENYQITENLGLLKITPNTTTIKITAASDEKFYDGDALTNNDIELEGLPAGLSVVSANEGTITDVGTVANRVISYKIMDGDEDVTKFFENIEVADGKLEVKALPIIVEIEGKTDSFKYDGTEHVVEGYDVTAIKDAEGKENKLYKESYFTFGGTAQAARTVEGKTDMGLKAGDFTNTNTNFDVTFRVTDGYVEILPLTEDEKFVVNVSTNDVTIMYDGEEHGGFDYNISAGVGSGSFFSNMWNAFTGLFGSIVAPIRVNAADGEKRITVNGKDFTVTGLSVDVSKKNVGTYPLTINGTMKVTDEKGNDVTDMFKMTVTNIGDLTIYKRPITVTSGTSTKVYDGTPLTDDTIILQGSWVGKDAVDYVFTGSQTEVGFSDNTFDIVPREGTDLGNYDLNQVTGTLTVTAAGGGGGEPTPPTPTPTPTPPTPTPPTPDVVTIIDAPAPLAATPLVAAPEAAVLGERRAVDGQQVLGARRARTADDTNAPARLFAIIIAAAVAAFLLITGKREEEKEEN